MTGHKKAILHGSWTTYFLEHPESFGGAASPLIISDLLQVDDPFELQFNCILSR